MMLLLASILSYLIGSIPFGLILVYIFLKKNIQNEGSGNIGTTNVLRTAGKTLAIFTLLFDFLKGFIVAIICKSLNLDFWYIPGFLAVIGHLFPIWLKFKGGKGVSTFFGFLLAVNIYLFFFTVITWLIIAFIFRYSSLAALISVILVPFYSIFLKVDTNIMYILSILVILIIIKHKSNIIKLLNKREDKIKLS